MTYTKKNEKETDVGKKRLLVTHKNEWEGLVQEQRQLVVPN